MSRIPIAVLIDALAEKTPTLVINAQLAESVSHCPEINARSGPPFRTRVMINLPAHSAVILYRDCTGSIHREVAIDGWRPLPDGLCASPVNDNSGEYRQNGCRCPSPGCLNLPANNELVSGHLFPGNHFARTPGSPAGWLSIPPIPLTEGMASPLIQRPLIPMVLLFKV